MSEIGEGKGKEGEGCDGEDEKCMGVVIPLDFGGLDRDI